MIMARATRAQGKITISGTARPAGTASAQGKASVGKKKKTIAKVSYPIHREVS